MPMQRSPDLFGHEMVESRRSSPRSTVGQLRISGGLLLGAIADELAFAEAESLATGGSEIRRFAGLAWRTRWTARAHATVYVARTPRRFESDLASLGEQPFAQPRGRSRDVGPALVSL